MSKKEYIIGYVIAAIVIYGIIYYYWTPISKFLGIGSNNNSGTNTGTGVGPGGHPGGSPTTMHGGGTITIDAPINQKSLFVCRPQGAVSCAKEYRDQSGVIYILDHQEKQNGLAMCCYRKI